MLIPAVGIMSKPKVVSKVNVAGFTIKTRLKFKKVYGRFVVGFVKFFVKYLVLVKLKVSFFCNCSDFVVEESHLY